MPSSSLWSDKMAIYAVSYDLINELSDHDYQPLWDEFDRLKAHKTQYSTYLLNSAMTPQQIVEHFKKFADDDDRVMAIKFTPSPTGHWYTNAMDGTNAWLLKNPPQP